MRINQLSRIVTAIIGSTAILTCHIHSAEAANVAAGKPVSVTTGSVNGVSLSSLTDGVFSPRFTDWQTDTVWWLGTTSTLEIDLGESLNVDGAIVQTDDNDAYLLEAFDVNAQTWVSWWNVPNFDSFGFGLQTRPNVNDDNEWQNLPSILTNRLRFSATSGDNAYSVSEIQVRGYASPVPTPALLPGLIGMGAAVLRKRKQQHSIVDSVKA